MADDRPNLVIAATALLFTLLSLLLTSSGSRSTGVTVPEKKVNINEAGMDELLSLPGVGGVKAGMIVELRRGGGIDRRRLESALGRKVFGRISSKIRF